MSGATTRRGGSSSKHGKRRHVPYKSDHTVKPAPTNSEINVTPFVDVCLVLLIIFMVITPVLVNGPHVELPEATRAAAVPTAAKVLTLQADHALLLDGNPLAPGDLPEALR